MPGQRDPATTHADLADYDFIFHSVVEHGELAVRSGEPCVSVTGRSADGGDFRGGRCPERQRVLFLPALDLAVQIDELGTDRHAVTEQTHDGRRLVHLRVRRGRAIGRDPGAQRFQATVGVTADVVARQAVDEHRPAGLQGHVRRPDAGPHDDVRTAAGGCGEIAAVIGHVPRDHDRRIGIGDRYGRGGNEVTVLKRVLDFDPRLDRVPRWVEGIAAWGDRRELRRGLTEHRVDRGVRRCDHTVDVQTAVHLRDRRPQDGQLSRRVVRDRDRRVARRIDDPRAGQFRSPDVDHPGLRPNRFDIDVHGIDLEEADLAVVSVLAQPGGDEFRANPVDLGLIKIPQHRVSRAIQRQVGPRVDEKLLLGRLQRRAALGQRDPLAGVDLGHQPRLEIPPGRLPISRLAAQRQGDVAVAPGANGAVDDHPAGGGAMNAAGILFRSPQSGIQRVGGCAGPVDRLGPGGHVRIAETFGVQLDVASAQQNRSAGDGDRVGLNQIRSGVDAIDRDRAAGETVGARPHRVSVAIEVGVRSRRDEQVAAGLNPRAGKEVDAVRRTNVTRRLRDRHGRDAIRVDVRVGVDFSGTASRNNDVPSGTQYRRRTHGDGGDIRGCANDRVGASAADRPSGRERDLIVATDVVERPDREHAVAFRIGAGQRRVAIDDHIGIEPKLRDAPCAGPADQSPGGAGNVVADVRLAKLRSRIQLDRVGLNAGMTPDLRRHGCVDTDVDRRPCPREQTAADRLDLAVRLRRRDRSDRQPTNEVADDRVPEEGVGRPVLVHDDRRRGTGQHATTPRHCVPELDVVTNTTDR